MKQLARFIVLIVAVSLVVFVVAGCGDKASVRDTGSEASSEAVAQTHDHDHQTATPAEEGHEILETMDSGGYTYLLLAMGDEKVWAAGPTTAGMEVGQKVIIDGAMEMNNFTSKSLDRTFEKILFATGIRKAGETAASESAGHDGMGGMSAMGQADPSMGSARTQMENAKIEGVVKADGGYTVEEIYAGAASLANQEVTLRGLVVKFSPNIMGTNWVHVQDGSGDDKTSDLTVTTSNQVQVGDLVLVKGPLSVDKDFGSGYKYHVIVEGATVTKE